MIKVRDIRVDYGDVTAVEDLRVTIETGEVFGLIGPNGAGKTSLIRVLATLQEPTYGEAWIDGMDIVERRSDVRRILGYMPDMAPVYEDLRCWEFLDLFARAYFVGRTVRRSRVEECLDEVGLTSKRDVMAGTLSLGMKQRLVLAKTLLHDPSVLLMDEPASGLDPIARVDLRNLLNRLADQGKTILVSSHILTELSEFCTSVGIMEKGRLVLSGNIDQILAGMNQHKRIVVEAIGGGQLVADWLSPLDSVSEVEARNGKCEFKFDGSDEDAAALLKRMVEQKLNVKAFYERRQGVEDIMMQIGAREVS